jgi:hypothetical protein
LQERALGYRHEYDGLLRLDLGLDRTATEPLPLRSYTHADDWASSTSNASISNSIAINAFRRAMLDDLISKVINQRQLSTSSNSHYNTIEPRSVHNYSSSAYNLSSGNNSGHVSIRRNHRPCCAFTTDCIYWIFMMTGIFMNNEIFHLKEI